MAVRTTALTTPTASATGTLLRDVADTIRHLWPGNAIQALTSSGMAIPGEDVVREKGLIGKRRVETPKYEAFTYTPQAIAFTQATYSSATQFTVTSADGLTLKMVLYNTRTGGTARVEAISGTTITVTSIGDTSFGIATAAPFDTFIALGPAYAENSSSPYILMKDPDNMYNLTQIFRFACAVSRTASKNPHFGGNRWKLTKEENVAEGMRKVELAMILNQKPSSTNETTTGGTLGDSFRTFDGLVQWAGATPNAGGNMTMDWWMTDLAEGFDTSVGTRNKMVGLCGTHTYAKMLKWIMDKGEVALPGNGSYEKYGVETKKFVTAKGTVEVMVHDAFDQTDLKKQMLIICPELIDYVVFQDDDFHPKLGIQNNDVDGKEDEIIGEVSICPRDAGKSITLISNIW